MTAKKHLSPELESGAVQLYSSSFEIVGSIWRKPVLTHASTVCDIAGVGEFGESYDRVKDPVDIIGNILTVYIPNEAHR